MRYSDEVLAVSVLGLRPVLMQVVEALGDLRLQVA